tara:strand:+ start:448 stop:1086 length:639 start_codon:yes stop_codon:yes gene_type:complete
MDAAFWHQRWDQNQIAFHEGTPNKLLVQHLDALALPPGARVFLPLCGKTQDIGWLLNQGYQVAGAELSASAVEQLFAELGRTPVITTKGEMQHHADEGLDIFVGDIFALTGQALGAVDAIYDRAALVALPDSMRKRYAAHLRTVTSHARQLLLCFEYDQHAMAGPPFSINGDMVAQLYQDHYSLTQLACIDVPGGLKGLHPAKETAWLLQTV